MNSPIQKLQAAVIGCGRMGRLHAERLHDDGRAQVTAIFDEHRAAAERLRDELAPAAAVYATFEELLERAHVDAAVICTPTTFHFDQALACRRELQSHVLCEKPLADTRERIVALVEESRRDGLMFSVAYQRRHWAVYKTLRSELLSGRWGHVRSIVSHNAERWQQTIGGTWRDDPVSNPGGFVGDAGGHKIDIVVHLTDLAPVDVFARSEFCGSRVEIVTMATVQLSRGIPLSIDFVGNAESFAEDLHIQCSEGDLMLRRGRLWTARENQFHRLEPQFSDSNPVQGFLNTLIDGAINLAPAECALPVFDLTQAILMSGRERRVVPVSGCASFPAQVQPPPHQ